MQTKTLPEKSSSVIIEVVEDVIVIPRAPGIGVIATIFSVGNSKQSSLDIDCCWSFNWNCLDQAVKEEIKTKVISRI